MKTTQLLIEIKNLTYSYNNPGCSPNPVLKNINLQIETGELLAIVGLSGSGKTTLIQHITGLLKPDIGQVCVLGKDIWQKETNQTDVRRRIGLVFQFPETQLFKETVYEDIACGPNNLGLTESEVEKQVLSALQCVGLDVNKYRNRSPFHLSDGEKRRVAMAGIIALQPDCLIFDEPTASLDASGVKAVIKIIKKYHSTGKTIVIISHNLDLVVSLVNRVVLLNRGQIHFDGPVKQLLSNINILTDIGIPEPLVVNLIDYAKGKQLIQEQEIVTFKELKRELLLWISLKKKGHK